MYSSILLILISCLIILLILVLGYFYFGPFASSKKELQTLKEKVVSSDELIDQRVRERTKQLEEIRDTVTGYAVQRFEIARELEEMNREILEQKDYASKQSARLKEAYDEIKKLESFRQQMVRMIIHDLKNPLNVILNITDNQKIPSKPRNMIRQISFEMLDLIMNILEVQKFEDLKMKIEPQSLGLSEVISGVAGKLTILFENSAIEFKASIPEGTRVLADPHILGRIIENLCGNAIKYTPSGGEVSIVATSRDQEIQVQIIDNGMGIPPRYLDSLFDEYAQGQKNETLYNNSTGIGLAYCKLAVEAHGGKIGIESAEGMGTTVWFTLKNAGSADPNDVQHPDEILKLNHVDHKLSAKDIELLAPLVVALRNIDLYDVTRILALTGTIPEDAGQAVILWKDSIEEAVFSANRKRFESLINLQ
jgi:signal transduction histidine kinase